MLSAVSDLPTSSLIVLGFLTALGSLVIGATSNMILRDVGCGTFLNGLLVVVGAMLGVWTRYLISGNA